MTPPCGTSPHGYVAPVPLVSVTNEVYGSTPGLPCRARGGFERRGATEVVEAERIREEPDALGQHRVSRELAVFVAAHDVEAVAVAELALVRELRLDRLGGVIEVLLLRQPVPQRHT